MVNEEQKTALILTTEEIESVKRKAEKEMAMFGRPGSKIQRKPIAEDKIDQSIVNRDHDTLLRSILPKASAPYVPPPSTIDNVHRRSSAIADADGVD
jgi:hypothetical protein